jgi:hypothetical protein
MNTAFASYVIVAWVVLAVVAFPSFPPRRAVLFILLSGTLFLPVLEVGMVELGPVKFSKTNAVCYALLLACLLFDAKRLFAVTPSWADLPVLVWCVIPAVSVLLNDPPPDGSPALRDAVSQSLVQTTRYLIPYLIGRVYFSDPDGMRALAAGIVAAALVYVPFCLFEVRMSPQLHVIVYGYMPHDFDQQVRFGGYRPMVFLGHGGMVALFMGMALILAAWTRNTDPAAGGWHNWAVWVLGPSLLLCKSVGPTVLACVGLVLPTLARSVALRVALLGLVAIPPAYCLVRSTGYWDGTNLVELVEDSINEERAQSLQFRFEQENELIARALERPAFGWGGWGRNLVRDENNKGVSVTDGLWILIMGTNGIVGLMVYGAMTLLPVARYAWLLPPAAGASCPYAASSGCAVVIGLWCVDSLLNATALPLFIVMVGGLTRVRFADETSRKGVGQGDAQQDRSECDL